MQVILRNSIKDQIDDLILRHDSNYIDCIVLNHHEWWDFVRSLNLVEKEEYGSYKTYRKVKIEKE